jgi:glycosyltransferase involved in cell wall biosynthesis
MPVKNSVKYIQETLESIAEQQGVSYELLAYDNGSTDGTLEILNEWIPQRIPGRVISDCPTSYPESLAKLVLLANTEYIARIDSDDVMVSNRLIRQVEFLNVNPEIGLLGTGMLTMDSGSNITGVYGWNPVPTEHSSILLSMLAFQPPIAHPSVMMRRDLVLRAGNYRDIYAVEDFDLWLRIAQVSKLAILSENLTIYRQHSASVTAGVVADKTLESRGRSVLIDNAGAFGLASEELSNLLSHRHFMKIFDFNKLRNTLGLDKFDSTMQMYFLFIGVWRYTKPTDLVTRIYVSLVCWSGCKQILLKLLRLKIRNCFRATR